mmetsp:Transcript_17460/g.52463  ORF Transcript_17460/g.52463 Transcript_17460/m.52463 type:complete len:275 (+) Transcript_17460:1421-2245(+)
MSNAGAHSNVGLQHILDALDGLGLFEHLGICARLQKNLIPCSIWWCHQADQVLIAFRLLALSADHQPDRLIKDVDLVRLQIQNGIVQVAKQLRDERLVFLDLLHNELAPALVRNFQECVASHVLYTRMCLMHELEQLVDDRLQKLPMSTQELWILANHIHDVGCDHCLVVLAASHFAEIQQVTDHCHQKSILLLLLHAARNAPNCPAQGVEPIPGPLGGATHLLVQLFQHLHLSVLLVKVAQVHKCLTHRLVLLQDVVVLHRLTNNVAILILNH